MQKVDVIEKQPSLLVQKLRDYAELTKIRLSLTVGISAGLGYLFGADLHNIHWASFGLFFAAGLMVTCASNILNEIIEKDSDKLMTRTMNRPLPTGNMSVAEAMLSAGIMGVIGVLILSFQFNLTAGVLAAVSLLSYAFIYTPLKKVSSIAVFVGAIPGALPPMIGYVCASGQGEVDYFVAISLFAIQFLWQFPHFWSIAWIRYEEYLNAGINMMPSASGKTRMTAIHSVIYCAGLLIVSMVPYFMGWIGIISAGVIAAFGAVFLWLALEHYQKCTDASAKKVLYTSFLYLPVVQLALVLGRI
ncbi:MAG: protoheme IX farnesyltransferase [Bacteroidetes bacterium]|nr:protoheme IX farnesyltransferase [Bacteroidota bacterium]